MECWRRKHPPLQKLQDPAPPAVFVGQIIWSFGQLKSTLPCLPDLHIWNNYSPPTKPVLKLSPRGNSSWQPLHCQHQRHEATKLQAARKRRGSKAFQRLCRPSRELERHRESVLVSKTPIRLSNYLFQGDILSPQWSSCKTFWYWQDKRVGWPEILVAVPKNRRRELCPRMQRFSNFKSRPSQALWRPAFLACIKSSMERPFYGLCDRLTVVHRLEGRQLQLNPRHCRPVDQDVVLPAI